RAIWKEFQEATAVAGIEAHLLDVRTPSDIVSAFDGARKQRINALLVTIDTLTQTNQQLIIELATKYRLPAIFMSREFVDAGGLISYGVHYPDLYRRAATHVHKILNGAKPADLPVEQPTKFGLVINLKTAKILDLEVPPTLLARADDKQGVQAVIVPANGLFRVQRAQLAQLALAAGLPTISAERQYVEGGLLASYGINERENYRRAASYVDRVLKGAKAGDLPVEFPTTIALTINLGTAKAMGLYLSPTVVTRADEVIE